MAAHPVLKVLHCMNNPPCCASPACYLRSRNCPTVSHMDEGSSLELQGKKINCVTRRQIVCISVMFNSITQIAANTQVKTKKKKAQPKNYPNPLFKVLRNPNMLRHHTKYKCSTYPQNSSKEISCGETAVYHCIFHRL